MNIENLPTRYDVGSASIEAGQVTVTPTNASWYGNVWGGDLFWLPSQPLVPPQRIETVNEDGTLTLAFPWPGASATEEPYEVRYVGIIERSTAQTRRVIEELGKISPYYDIQVDTLADRANYDDERGGFAVLVSDTGDGRSAIYSKNSSTSGDWSDPAYVTGPFADVTVGAVTELDYGDAPTITGTSGPGTLELDFGLPGGPALSVGTVTRGDADVTSTPVTGGYELDFTIPSQVAQGDYNGATAYVTGDIVQDQGSSWVALQASTGNAPPTLPTTSNSYWQLLARAGNDGAGTVTSLAGGTGIDIDSTDPTVPVVSAAIASQAEAEAGTVANKLMTPERTAQAIAELSPEVPADLYRPNNILGTVSQSGGVPTGAIIEHGSNANGEYVRYADGTQICWNPRIELTYNNGGWVLATWTFPAVFVDAEYALSSSQRGSNNSTAPQNTAATATPSAPNTTSTRHGNRSATEVDLAIGRQSGTADFEPGDTLYVTGYATGRWF